MAILEELASITLETKNDTVEEFTDGSKTEINDGFASFKPVIKISNLLIDLVENFGGKILNKLQEEVVSAIENFSDENNYYNIAKEIAKKEVEKFLVNNSNPNVIKEVQQLARKKLNIMLNKTMESPRKQFYIKKDSINTMKNKADSLLKEI